MLITRKHNKAWQIVYDDYTNAPVGPRLIKGEPFYSHGYDFETQEEAEAERLRWEQYLTEQEERETKRRKKK